MEDEDLEETNNEDRGQRARRLATLILMYSHYKYQLKCTFALILSPVEKTE